MERLIVILALILIGTAVFAEQTVQYTFDNTPVVTREKKKEEVKPEPKKEVQIKKELPCYKKVPNTTKTVNNPKNTNNPQYLGLKIYKTEKLKQKVVKTEKIECKDNPKSICNAKFAKPYNTAKTPRYYRTYNDKYRKFSLPDYQPLKPAQPIPVIKCTKKENP